MAIPPIPEQVSPEMPLPVPGALDPGTLAPAATKDPAETQKALQRVIWFGIFVITLLFISPATVLMLFFGLMPSFVALIIDRGEGKNAMFCVLGLNFSGLFPFMSDVWFGDHSIDGATNVMTDVFSLLVIYGAAGFGWMLYMALPPVVTSFLSVMSTRRVELLRETQAEIVVEWGEGVAEVMEAAPEGEEEAPV